jgi:agmatine deiminase
MIYLSGSLMIKAAKYRLPAEWEPHYSTLLCWPSNPADWPGKFIPIHWVYAEIIKKLIADERVLLITRDKKQENFVRAVLIKTGINWDNLVFHHLDTDRNWMRDSAPVFVLKKSGKKSERVAMHFLFNGWAKYPNWKKDAKTPRFIAGKINCEIQPVTYRNQRVVLEGGAIDGNGAGTIITTEECLLDPAIQVRNPGFTKVDYEKIFADYLGISKVIWLGKGITGDDTHGHIDDLCRFVAEDTVVLCREQNPAEENYALLEENHERLQGAVNADGTTMQVIDLPMPEPIIFDGMRVPASYANFYIGNSVVLVPTFNDPNDRIALGILSELFPNRHVVGIHAVDLVWGLGTLHCLSHEIPEVQ